MKVTIIGIGLMGGNMALALKTAGFAVTGYDVSAQSRAKIEAQGVPTTDDMAQALTGAQVIVSSLPNSEIVRTAFYGENGVLAHAGGCPGAVLLEMSSIDPETMTDLALACRDKGLVPLDVPVSGGPAEALAGTLVLLVGGAEADIARAAPVLDVLGGSRHFTGDVGTAKVVKLVNNVMTMGNVLVAAEAFAMGTRAGVDPDRLYDVLSQSGGRSHHFTKRFPKALRQDFDPGFKMFLGEKDVALAVDVARSLGQPMPVASLVREMYQMAMALGYRDKDIVALLDMFQRMGEPQNALSGEG